MGGHIDIIPFNDEDYNNHYGDRKIEIGKCFTNENGFFYLQQKDYVLHLNANGPLINKVHVGYLNIGKFKEITYHDFKIVVKKMIYELELDKFWNK